jgi:hypothetical protein
MRVCVAAKTEQREGNMMWPTVQPAASAGATLRVIIDIGKFQGVMAATTPTCREYAPS